MSYTKGYRYNKVPGVNNKYAIPTKEIVNPVYAATIALTPSSEDTIVDHAQLTGDLTETVSITNAYTGDKLRLIYNTDATVRTVTFSTGFIAGSTLVIQDSSQAVIDFVFMGQVGASGTWVEVTRMNFL